MKAHVVLDAPNEGVDRLEITTAKSGTTLYTAKSHQSWLISVILAPLKRRHFPPLAIFGVIRKASKSSGWHPADDVINRIIAKIRTRIEHLFRGMKHKFGYLEIRCLSLVRNNA